MGNRKRTSFMVVPVDNKEYLVDVRIGGKCPRIPVPMSVIKEKLANHEIVEEAQRYFQLSF
ncbi:hypothetical protein ACFY5J_25975 [Peribacillus butanolivorans]|uniref:hypothetical protein n=1 Tax=Peribacillus butanolivorans TaxID=421767 RepID=UPI0036729E20